MKRLLVVLIICLPISLAYAQKPRARDLGVPFNGTTGQWNSITDVKGVEVLRKYNRLNQ